MDLMSKRGAGVAVAITAVALASTVVVTARANPVKVGAAIELTGKYRVMGSDLQTGAGMQQAGATGTVVEGPVVRLGKRWWRVDFGQGVDGWVNEAVLRTTGVIVITPPSPTPTPTPLPPVMPAPTPPPSAGVAGAFANPDNGAIPDRARHPLAFPTATGFGKHTSVRSPNAVVYKINTLDDVANPGDGKISYRECALALPVTSPYNIPANRPRYCVFDVAGAIVLQSSAFITQPQIYIAGQTSPGGIEFRLGAQYNPVDSLIDTRHGGSNMILRHVRTRTGPHLGRTSENGDPIRMSGTRNQIIDHVSTMFGTDESLDMACIDCTVQWSIIGPNICRNAGHTSSLHCKTFFLKPASRVTIAHNLSQHGEQRGINIAVGTNPATAGATGQVDVVNNVLYNFIAEAGLVSNQFGSVYANYVNNAYLRGPRYNASDGNYLIGLYGNGARFPFGFNIHATGNVTPRTRIAGQFGSTATDPYQNAAGFIAHVSASSICGLTSSGAQDCSRTGLATVQNAAYALMPGLAAPTFDPARVVSAEQAFRDVLTFAGADLCRDGACRDNVDQMYVEDVRSCDTAPYLFASNWPSTVAEAGGWAQITPGSAKRDSDNDGMPDDWESRFTNTNPNVWDANADADGDGYPNIEEYLNALAQDDARYYGMAGFGTGRVPAYNCARPMF
ncbi:hypothetical protein [Sphingomonas sp.]|uniref:hypothetical protein n=1 Tax=Sphingomonas sp. TaxID=28214 RepID=UPI002ED97814